MTIGARPLRLVTTLVVVSLLVPLVLQSGAASADSVSNERARAAGLAGQLAAINTRASELAEAYDQAEIHLQTVESDLATDKSQLGQTGTQLSGAEARVRYMAIQSYMDGGAARELSLLIPGSETEIADRSTYVAAATGSDYDAIDLLRAAHIELGRQQATLDASQAEATAALNALNSAAHAAAAADRETAAAYDQAEAELGQALLAQAQQARIAAEQAAMAERGYSSGIGAPSFAPPPPSPEAGLAIQFADAELGKPYVWGGSGPDDFDCSGLTAWAWGHAGHALPHSSEDQYYDTTHVSVAQLEPGDLVFYGYPPHHVGIYVGNDEMIDALHSGTNVEYDTIFIESDLIGGGRVN